MPRILVALAALSLVACDTAGTTPVTGGTRPSNDSGPASDAQSSDVQSADANTSRDALVVPDATFSDATVFDAGASGCSALAEGQCRNANGCRWDECGDCDGEPMFGTCSSAGSPHPGCPPIACEDCTSKREDDCVATRYCRPVYDGSGVLACACDAPGCCVVFDFCVLGRKADCTGPVTCRRAEPIGCEGPYTIGYANMCYEGCVRRADCQ